MTKRSANWQELMRLNLELRLISVAAPTPARASESSHQQAVLHQDQVEDVAGRAHAFGRLPIVFPCHHLRESGDARGHL